MKKIIKNEPSFFQREKSFGTILLGSNDSFLYKQFQTMKSLLNFELLFHTV